MNFVWGFLCGAGVFAVVGAVWIRWLLKDVYR